jgi:ubiquinone/menaquinone biosynthesis C-methylase UbiE
VEVWDIKSGFYHALRKMPVVRKWLDAEVRNLAFLLGHADIRIGRSLDLGSGAGSTLDVLPKGMSIVCSDKSEGMARRLKTLNPQLSVVRLDAATLPFKDRSFDFVSAVGLTEYLKDKTYILTEVKRVLGRGGVFLVTVSPPGFTSLFRHAHGLRIFPMKQDDWEKQVLSAGFSIIARSESAIQHQYLLGK